MPEDLDEDAVEYKKKREDAEKENYFVDDGTEFPILKGFENLNIKIIPISDDVTKIADKKKF